MFVAFLTCLDKMAAEQENNIKFVQEIERYPDLYNYKLPDYKRKDTTDKTWDEIGKKFKLTGPEAKEKWKNLRSVFVRHLKPPKSGSAKSHKKPYYLADYMQFAIPFIKLAGIPSGNFKEANDVTILYDDGTELQSPELWEQTRLRENLPKDTSTTILQEESSQHSLNYQSIWIQQPIPPSTSAPSPIQPKLSPPSSPIQQPATSSKTKRKQIDESQIEQNSSNYFKMIQSKMTEDYGSVQNSNKMFLLSILPDMNEMNDVKRRLFKRKVLELVDNILDENSE